MNEEMVKFKAQIICDTRQKPYKHTEKHKQIKSLGYEIVNYALPCGDYQFFGKGDIVIDTKRDVLELISCIHQDHVRFRNEVILAQRNKVKLIILTEEKLPPQGLVAWKSPLRKSDSGKFKKGEPYTKTNPESLKKALITMQEKYGVVFLFCDPSESGAKIIELLNSE